MNKVTKDDDEVADYEAEIRMLVAMGFPVEHASEAMDENGGDIDRAIVYLVVGGTKSTKQAEEKKKKSRVTKAGPHAKKISNKGMAMSDDTIPTSRRDNRDDKTKKDIMPKALPDTVALSSERCSYKHVHQFDVIDDTIEPSGTCRISGNKTRIQNTSLYSLQKSIL